jgi:hypothetical protein
MNKLRNACDDAWSSVGVYFVPIVTNGGYCFIIAKLGQLLAAHSGEKIQVWRIYIIRECDVRMLVTYYS